jgi:periplasmic copper chaperone A
MFRSMIGAVAMAATALVAASAWAHVTLERATAPAGSYYKAVIRVPHGCDGAATIAIRVQIPQGVLQAKPMPKPGWTLKTVIGKLAKPYEWEGTLIAEDVKEIEWSGGELPDADYDEFVFRAKLPDGEGDAIWFPVIQTCAKGENRWIEIPAAGKSEDDYEFPAPGLTLTAPTGGDD